MCAEVSAEPGEWIAALALERGGERGKHGFTGERFGQERDDAHVGGPALMLGSRVSAHEDDLRREMLPTQHLANLQAIRSGQNQIHENDVGVIHRGGVDRFTARSCGHNGAVFVLEPRGDQMRQLGGVVHDQRTNLIDLAPASRRNRAEHRRPHAITCSTFEEGAGIFVADGIGHSTAARASRVHKGNDLLLALHQDLTPRDDLPG